MKERKDTLNHQQCQALNDIITRMAIRVNLELDAEFDGEAVVGVVLLVAAFVVPDGGIVDGNDNNVSALQAVTQ